jgi:hypothetical protein
MDPGSKHLVVPPLSDEAKLTPTVCIWRLLLVQKEVEFGKDVILR